MNNAQTLAHWRRGFDEPALESQQTFMAIFAAMELPGQLVTIHQNTHAPDIFNWASPATCLTLLGRETPVWIDIDQQRSAVSWLQYFCQSSVVTEPCMANVAIITKPVAMPDLGSTKGLTWSSKAFRIISGIYGGYCPAGILWESMFS